jgi:hypothetical protein
VNEWRCGWAGEEHLLPTKSLDDCQWLQALALLERE